MSKFVFTAVVVTVTLATAGYYVVTKTELLESRVETPAPQTAEKSTGDKPLHGDFHKRFQPTLPPSEGSSGK
jgi:hypothetical protein